jgi:hypothetical protein
LPEENRTDFLELVASFRSEHQPATAFEEALVFQLAAADWRLRLTLETPALSPPGTRFRLLFIAPTSTHTGSPIPSGGAARPQSIASGRSSDSCVTENAFTRSNSKHGAETPPQRKRLVVIA